MDYPAEFVEQLVSLSRSLAGDADVALQRVADLAVEQLSGCDLAGVTLVRDGVPTTAVFTDPEAPEIDRAQYDTGQGPCLDAYHTGVILRIDETMDEKFSGISVGLDIRTWVANGVAPVKSEVSSNAAGRSTIASLQELKSFTRG